MWCLLTVRVKSESFPSHIWPNLAHVLLLFIVFLIELSFSCFSTICVYVFYVYVTFMANTDSHRASLILMMENFMKFSWRENFIELFTLKFFKNFTV